MPPRPPARPALLLGALLVLGVLAARPAPVPAAQATVDSLAVARNTRPSFQVPRVTDGIRTDGELDDPQWQEAARLGGFSEWQPQNLAQPPVDTEVLVAYDSQQLHVAIIAHDDPASIRATMCDRDGIYQDDFVGLFLDPTGTGSWAYELWSNPLGVQGDILWTPTTEDTRFDIVYQTKGKITAQGYQVEMAIPFTSIRFPSAGARTWRVNFWRNRPRATRDQYSWAALSLRDPCWQCGWGSMSGIESVRPATSFEVLPAVTASQASGLRDQEHVASGLRDDPVDGAVGLNLRYSVASNLTAEAAINPDFSQIEADATEIDVNSTFALSYPEKRPFFQEGGDLFQTSLVTVYTRSINDPSGAVRATGRVGRASFAYISAVDEHSPHLLPFAEHSELLRGGRSLVNIGRLQRAFGSDSRAGLLVTDRRHDGGGAGTALGIDGSLRFLRTLRFVWEALATHTAEPNDPALTRQLTDTLAVFDHGAHTAAMDGESYWGNGVTAGLRRDGRVWNLSLDASQKSPTFRLENGFETQNDVRRVEMWNGLDFRLRDSFCTSITPSVDVARVWNFDGLRKDEWVRPELAANLRGQTTVEISYLWSRERFRGGEFDGIRRAGFELESNFSQPLGVGASGELGRFINRNAEVPVLGRGAALEAWATIKPLGRLVIEPSYQYSVLRDPGPDTLLFEGYIARVRTAYQFTRELQLRLIVQYDGFERALEVDPLFSYKVNPFTVFYAGSSHSYWNDESARLWPVSRHFFLKLQYLFRV